MEEKFENIYVQRKLEDDTNYVILIFNQDNSYIVKNKNKIDKIIINNEKQNLEQGIAVTKDTEVQVHYKTILRAGENFIKFISNTIKNKLVSINLSKFDSNLKTIHSMLSG